MYFVVFFDETLKQAMGQYLHEQGHSNLKAAWLEGSGSRDFKICNAAGEVFFDSKKDDDSDFQNN